MKKEFRNCVLLPLAGVLLSTACFGQSPVETFYKQKCLSCHGVNGMADSGVGKLMHVKPWTDPAVRKMSEAEMIAEVRDGAGRMQPYKGELSEKEIKGSVDYFRSFMK